MRALYLDHCGLQFKPNCSQPQPKSGEALLKIRLAGICNTDLEITNGYKGFTGVLGHEFVADVVEGSDAWRGKRVASEINIACGYCSMCQIGIPTQCLNRLALGITGHQGAFADYLCVPETILHEVPETMTDAQAVFVEPTAAAFQILESISFDDDTNVVLIGAGKLGMLCAQVLQTTGAKLRVVIRHNHQRQLLAKRGIESVEYDTLPKYDADVVVDCTGNASGFQDALSLVRPRGTIVLKSTYVGNPPADLSRIAMSELKIIGSRCGSFPQAIGGINSGLIDVDSLISATLPIENGVEAFELAQQKGIYKVLLSF